MAEYLSPAVFIEEIPSGIKPIEGVGTSTGAFVGHAERGPVGRAVPINNFAQFTERFGGVIANGYLAFAVKGFFDEGGTSCYVVRTVHYAVPGGGTVAVATALAGSLSFATGSLTQTGGTGALGAVSLVGRAADVAAIESANIALDATDPTDVTATAAGFTGSFAGDSTGLRAWTLSHANGNQVQVAVDVTTVFDGNETAAVITVVPLLTVEAESPGAWGDELTLTVGHPDAERFDLAVSLRGAQVESFAGLSMDAADARYVEAAVNGVSRFIAASDRVPAASTLTAAERRPSEVAAQALTGGNDGLANLGAGDYLGDPSLANGLHAFDAVDDVNIVAVPDAVDRDVHVGGMAYCAGRGDCFYVADSQEMVATADDVLNYKLAQGIYSGGNALNSKYGALYTPWIEVFDPRTGGRVTVPPSGAVAGRYAATDQARGVHKAPAGIEDGRLRSALGLAAELTATDQEKLNPRGINVIRRLSGVGRAIWGTRTVSADPEWRYLTVRRLFLFLEESIEQSTRWVVFEPNDRTLWKSIVRNVSAFLKLQWLAGALVGASEAEAFYVKCDEETNPPESIALGRVITEIGVAPSKPAEFVIFRISQFAGGAEVNE